jgi:hypothetical protein
MINFQGLHGFSIHGFRLRSSGHWMQRSLGSTLMPYTFTLSVIGETSWRSRNLFGATLRMRICFASLTTSVQEYEGSQLLDRHNDTISANTVRIPGIPPQRGTEDHSHDCGRLHSSTLASSNAHGTPLDRCGPWRLGCCPGGWCGGLQSPRPHGYG